jgi:hypothetical protein
MIERDGLTERAEDDRMYTGDVTCADGMYTDGAFSS